jgi:homoserine dehydrogenase
VGGGVVRLLDENAAKLSARVGAPLELKRVLVRDLDKPRVSACPRAIVTRDADEVLGDPAIDLVVEVIGGEEAALGYLRRALEAGKSVVTANKLLLATRGSELLDLARRRGADLAFEGAVGGGIPIVRTLREAFASDRVTALVGILNGTSNYVLSRMLDDGLDQAAAVAEAQRLGYAEADPSMDVGGHDAAHKLAIVARLAFGAEVGPDDVSVEGIEAIEPIDHRLAQRFGYRIKPLVVARDHGERIELRVHPALIGERSVLANVSGVLNAVLLHGRALGPCLVSGQGAGALPTAVSVVADIIDVARAIVADVRGLVTSGLSFAPRPVMSASDVELRYYLRFTVRDEPGVVARLAGSLGDHRVSIEQMVQDGRAPREGEPASVVIVTHRARQAALFAALDDLRDASFMTAPVRMLRIEDV